MTTSYEHPRSAFGEVPGHPLDSADKLLGGLDELVAYCSVQVGYQPTQSVCLVAMRPGPNGTAALGPVARMDAAPLLAGTASDLMDWGESLRNQFRSYGFAAMSLVLFGGHQPGASFRRDPHLGSTYKQMRASAQVERLLGLLGHRDTDVMTTLLVGSDAWGHFECPRPLCCPAVGRPLNLLQATQIMAGNVLSGHVVAGSRDELRVARCTNRSCLVEVGRIMRQIERDAHVDRVTRGCDAWTRALLRRSTADAARAPGDVEAGGADSAAVFREEGESAACDAHEIAELAAAVISSHLRDAVLAFSIGAPMDSSQDDAGECRQREGSGTRVEGKPGGVLEMMDAVAAGRALECAERPGPRVDRCITLLMRVAAHAPDGARVQALAALGYLYWWQGRGAHAKVAIDDALSIDSGHRLANLVDQILFTRVPPLWALA